MEKFRTKKISETLFFYAVILGALLCLYLPKNAYGSAQKIPPEIEIGRKVFEQIKPYLKYPNNPLIRHTIEQIGHRVLKNLPATQYEFRFFPIIANDVNAFALPNGYIFITNRLIQTCDSEDELAFVLSHEIAHVVKGHFMNFVSQQTKVDITTLAIIILGAMVAQDKDLQESLPVLGLGINQNLTLSYSRLQETEADTYGFRFLNEAGFNAEGASKFMDKMRLLSQITISMPVYLSTHPMPIDRLVNIKRLDDFYSSKMPRCSVCNIDRLKLWTRLETQLSNRIMTDLTPLYADNPNDVDTIYGLALVHEKLGSSEDAENYYLKGLELAPKDGDLLRDLAIFLYKRDRMADAEKRIKQAVKVDPNDPLTQHYLGRIMMDQKHPEEAMKAFQRSINLLPEFPDNHHFLGVLYSQQRDESQSHKSFERYFSIIGNQQAADLHSKKKEQLENVMEEKKDTSK